MMVSGQLGITASNPPSLGAGLHFMRKSASHEPLGLDTSPSSASGCSVGPQKSSASATLSPTPASRKHQRLNLSDDGTRKATNPYSFLVGSSEEDDVFVEENAVVLASPGKEIQSTLNPASVDAQGIYPGTACMFVANLSQPYDDRALELEVTKAFSQFGEVWVKIKRDNSQMPFAFCQFTRDDHAQNAVRMGKGMIILGRPCRTEMARAHSSFIIYKKSGSRISLSEATDLLGELGEIAKAEFLHEDIRSTLNIAPAAVVTFKMYDNRRDPVKYFAQNQKFVVMANDPKRIQGTNTMLASGPPGDGGRDLMEEYDKDRRSAFIGNLPLSMTEELLGSIAGSCGEVIHVQLYKKLIPNGSGSKHCFGFVEFVRPDSADDLVTSLNGSDIDGYRVRVERKHSRTFSTPQRPLGQLRHVRSTIPRRRLPGELEMPSIDKSDTASPTRSFRSAGYALTLNSKTFSHNRGRRPRTTIFSPDTSLSKAASSGNLRHAAGTFDLHQGSPLSVTDQKFPESSPSAEKKSVEFKLPREESSEKVDTQSATPGPETQTDNPQTPNYQGQGDSLESQPPEASLHNQDGNISLAQPPHMAWMPPYSPYGYPYMGSPLTPQGAPGLMYGGYMAPPYYGAMYDMFGNIIVSPTPMMSPYHTSHSLPTDGNNGSERCGSRDVPE